MVATAGTLEIALYADVANLKRQMDQMQGVVKSANDNITSTVNRAGGAFAGYSKGVAGAGASSKLAGYQVQNLAYQANDLFVGLVSGQKPMTVFFQQGSQIAQIMAQAGIGVGGLAREVGGLTTNFLKAHPVLLIVAAAAALVAGGIALITDEINKNSKVTVTWKDTLLGAFDVVSNAVTTQVTAAFEAMGVDIGEVWKFVVAQTKAAFNFMIGAILLIPKTIAATYDKIGPAFGDAFYSAANLAIEALNFLAQSSVAPLNFIIDGFNAAFGKKIPPIVMGSIDALKNPYAGAMGQLGSAGAKAVSSAFGTDYIGNMADALGDAARARHLQDAAEKSGKEIGKKVGKAAGKQAGQSFADAFAEFKIPDVPDSIKQAMQIDAQNDNLRETIAGLEREARAVGLVGWQRERLLLILENEAKVRPLLAQLSEAEAAGMVPLANALREQIDLLNQINNMKLQSGDDAAASDAAIAAAQAYLNVLDQAVSQTERAADGMSDAFGRVGDAIGEVAVVFARYAADRERLQQQINDAEKAKDVEKAAKARADMLELNIDSYRQLAGAAKTFFREGSAGYKTMAAAEKAFALVQLANTAINVAAGAAKIFASLGPWGFPVVAAMVAVMAGLGFASSGGGSGTAPQTAEQVQAAQGTGTILGDSSAKSDSIAHSLELVAANTNKMLEYDNPMLRALKSIDSNIGVLTDQIAKELSLGGAFDTTGKVGTNTSGGGLKQIAAGGLLGVVGALLFGKTTTTKTLYDQGLQFDPQTLTDAIANGISGSTYQIIETVKKKSGILGIGGSTKTSYDTTTGALDSDMQRQVGLILGSLRDSVVGAAKIIGLDVQAALDTFQVEIGKISFKDLSPDEITTALENVFSKVGDQMAGFAVAGLEQFQQAGEGLFETLMRLAKDYQTIDVTLQSIGKTFGSVGASSIAARESLIALFGSLQDFVDATSYYQQNFLTPAQQIAPVQAQVQTTLAGLGLSSVDTIAEFKAVVDGIDLTTDAGQQLYATMMALAPAFYAVEQAQATAAQQAADLAKQKASLEIQLLEAQGKATEALAKKRQLELDALDPTLRALQQQIYAAQDLASATTAAKNTLSEAYNRESQALQSTIDRMGQLGDSLRDLRSEIFSTSDGAGSYAQKLAELRRVGRMAALGDETAMGNLAGVVQDFLPAAKANASSLVEYQRAQALAARYVTGAIGAADSGKSVAEQQLEQMKTQVGALIDINDSVVTVAQAIIELNRLLGGNGSTTGATVTPDRQQREERDRQRRDRDNRWEQRMARIEANTAQGAVGSNQTARRLRDVTYQGQLATTTVPAA